MSSGRGVAGVDRSRRLIERAKNAAPPAVQTRKVLDRHAASLVGRGLSHDNRSRRIVADLKETVRLPLTLATSARNWNPMSAAQNHNMRGATLAICFSLFAAILFVMAYAQKPMGILAAAQHDDGTYIWLGQQLASGHWFGPFSEMTLTKGPGYPVFLALNSYLGLPITISHAVFFCLSLGLFSWVIARIFRSPLLGMLTFIITLWHPAFLTDRILRDAIYPGQMFLALACLLYAILLARSDAQRVLWACLFGAAVGWFWLTREEGIWLALGIAFLLLCVAAVYWRSFRIRGVLAPMAGAAALFLAMHFVFAFGNWIAYGRFIVVDVKEKNFDTALALLQSVEDGDQIPFVAVSRSTRERIYEVSPTFATLRNFFDPVEGTPPWRIGCRNHLWTCGDIHAGVFIFALRDGAGRQGNYRSPAAASEFFGKMAQEVQSACETGRLRCRRALVSYLPHVSWDQIKRVPLSLADAASLMLLRSPVAAPAGPPSTGTPSALADALSFLNHPVHTPAIGSSRIALIGWYYRKGREWPHIEFVSADGSVVPLTLERRASPDIADHFKDERASRQRFYIEALCNEQCNLLVQRDDLPPLRIKLQDLLKAKRGEYRGSEELGTFTVDSAMVMAAAPIDLRTQTSDMMRAFLLAIYKISLPVALGFAIIAFIGSVILAIIRRQGAILIAIVATVWLLIGIRIGLIVLVDISSFSAIKPRYFLPAFYLSMVAVVLSFGTLAYLLPSDWLSQVKERLRISGSTERKRTPSVSAKQG